MNRFSHLASAAVAAALILPLAGCQDQDGADAPAPASDSSTNELPNQPTPSGDATQNGTTDPAGDEDVKEVNP